MIRFISPTVYYQDDKYLQSLQVPEKLWYLMHLNDEELKILNDIVSGYVDFAEIQVMRYNPLCIWQST